MSLVALVMTFSKVISLSLSLSLYASPILSHRSKQFQRYNDGWLFQHDAERRSYRSIPSDKNDRNYKKIHNSIYTVTRAIHSGLDYRAQFSLSFFSFFSFLVDNFRRDVSKNLTAHLQTYTYIHDREEHTPTFDSFPSSRSIDQFKRRYFRVFHSAHSVLGSLIVQLTRRGREC